MPEDWIRREVQRRVLAIQGRSYKEQPQLPVVHVLRPREQTGETLYAIYGEVREYKPEWGVIEIELDEMPFDPPLYVAARDVPEWMRVPEQIFEARASLAQPSRERFCLRILSQVGDPDESFEDIVADLEKLVIPIEATWRRNE
jgi:hypothetical protein